MTGESQGDRVLEDGGSATVEAVGLLIPVLAACVLLLVFGFRLAATGQTLTAITASAARAASLQPDPTAGLASARAEPNALTGRIGLRWATALRTSRRVALDASAFRPGGTAVVTLTCTLTTRALTGVQLPGTLTRAITSRAPIDRYSSQVEGVMVVIDFRGTPSGTSQAAPDSGVVVVWVLGVVLLTYLAVGIVVDLGSALTAKTATLDVAQQAARAGAGQLDLNALRRDGRLQLDPAAAQAAAETFLTTSGHRGTASATLTQVQVIATTRQPTVLLRVVGLDALTLSATATAARTTT